MGKALFGVIWLVVMAPSAQAQRIPVTIKVGWETVVNRLATVPADSEVGRRFPDDPMVICFAYDHLSFVIPIWTSRQGFAICKEFEGSGSPDRYWILKDQNTGNIASTFGVPEDRLRAPFLYYVPVGWFVLAGIALFVRLSSGPSPRKRFETLWVDPRYRTAVARLLNLEGQELPVVFDAIVLDGSPPDITANIDESVAWLEQEGIGRRKAIRDLDFLVRYLVDNGGIVMMPPPVARNTEPAPCAETPARDRGPAEPDLSDLLD